MRRVVHKYPLSTSAAGCIIALPALAKILTAQPDGLDNVYVWVEIDPSITVRERVHFYVLSPGMCDVPDDATYLSTYIRPAGCAHHVYFKFL